MGKRSFNVVARCAWSLALLCLLATNAAAQPDPGDPAAADAPAATKPVDIAALPPPARDEVRIVVSKSTRKLSLYRSGELAAEYPVVLGLQPKGRKRYANDARTPEGLYHVISKRRHQRWQYFLGIDYPNDEDRRTYDEALQHGRIPEVGGTPFAIGGSVGIHGSDRRADQEAGVDWTMGCIALRPTDIAAVAAAVPVGAAVWIGE